LKFKNCKGTIFTMLIGLQEWIMMKTSSKMQKMTKPIYMTTMKMVIQKKMKTSLKNMIESMRMNSKTKLKMKENKPIPTSIQKMMELLSYPNKNQTCKEVNLEDLQERADQCQDSNL
jgi:hypothetical protein